MQFFHSIIHLSIFAHLLMYSVYSLFVNFHLAPFAFLRYIIHKSGRIDDHRRKKTKKIRTLRGMAQKEFGVAVGQRVSPPMPPVGMHFKYGMIDPFMRGWLLRKPELKAGSITCAEYFEGGDNWNEVIVFISKDSNLNKAHIKFLENRFHAMALECGRYTVDNSSTPTKSSISEAEQAELEEFIYNAKILVNALGHKTFEPYVDKSTNSDDDNVFYLSVGGGKATCVPTSDGFVMLKGSAIHQTAADSLNIGARKKIEESREKGEIIDNVLQCDKPFPSSTAAAAFAVGYSISGPQQWKNARGKTLKSIEANGKN